MATRIEADGETWVATVDRVQPHPGVRAVVFSCVSNPLRPYHVVEVSATELPGPERLQDLPRERLVQLFADSDPLDVVHDPSADPRHPGGHPLPPEPADARERDRG
jgi:hypothetical protein